MLGDGKAVEWRPWYRLIQWSAVLVMFLLLLAGFLLGRFQPPMGQLAFCAFGVLTGAAFARMAHPVEGSLTRLGLVALGFVAASQVFFQLLVWSETWRVHPTLLSWRLWWATIVAAVGLGWLQVLWRSGARWEWKSGRATLGFTAGLGLLLGGLAFKPNPLASFPSWWSALLGLMALGAVVGSLILIRRWMKIRPKIQRSLPCWMRPALISTGLVVLSVGSFYMGRVTMSPPSPFSVASPALTSMPIPELKQRIANDLNTLRTLAKGMDELRDEAEQFHRYISVKQQAEGRAMYTPTENREIRRLFTEYLSHRDSLIRMAVLYSGYVQLEDEGLRARTYLLGYTAAAVLLESGRGLAARYLDNKVARAKLNEGEPGWLEPGMFDQVYYSVTSQEHLRKFKEHRQLLDANQTLWLQDAVFAEADFKWLSGRIHLGKKSVEDIDLNPVRAWLSRVARRLQDDAYSPVYEAQELMATFVGDTRIVRRAPFISVDLLHKTLKDEDNQLEPGDIILERRNWYLSNAFLPGFWPHTALYVGTEEQLKELEGKLASKGFVSDLKNLPKRKPGAAWEAYVQSDHGQPRVILEAVSDGVVFASAEHSLHADYVAVLRPNLNPSQKAEAIRRAFADYGKPYDFNFDFNTDSKLVCSELVYRAYEGLLDFQMEEVLGKKVITPLGIMRKFANEPKDKDSDPQLEFVFFLDTPSGASAARPADEKDCRESVNRPKVFNE